MLEGIRSLVEQRHPDPGVSGTALLPYQVPEVPRTMGTIRSGSQTDLQCGQYGTFPGAVLPVNKIDIVAELDFEFLVTHEILNVDFSNDSAFSGFAGDIDGGADEFGS